MSAGGGDRGGLTVDRQHGSLDASNGPRGRSDLQDRAARISILAGGMLRGRIRSSRLLKPGTSTQLADGAGHTFKLRFGGVAHRMDQDRFVVSDAVWAKVASLLPGKATDPGATGKDNRLFLEAVLWRVRTGSASPAPGPCPSRWARWTIRVRPRSEAAALPTPHDSMGRRGSASVGSGCRSARRCGWLRLRRRGGCVRPRPIAPASLYFSST